MVADFEAAFYCPDLVAFLQHLEADLAFVVAVVAENWVCLEAAAAAAEAFRLVADLVEFDSMEEFLQLFVLEFQLQCSCSMASFARVDDKP